VSILVTGHAGFIGFHVCERLIAHGENVVGVDSHSSVLYPGELKKINTERLAALDSNFTPFKFDLGEITHDFLEFQGIDSVIHLAAIPSQVSSWTHLSEYVNANIIATQKLLEAVKTYGRVKKFVHISTSSVYGRYVDGTDTMGLNPSSPYGITKLAAENLVKCYAEIADFEYVILRYFSVFGPGQRPDMAISQFLSRIKSNSEIFVTGDGTQTRDLTYVIDVANATISALKNQTPNNIYDISGGQVFSINQIISTCLKVTGSSLDISYIERPVGDQERTVGNRSQAVKDLGLRRTVSLDEGIANQWNCMKDNS